MSRCLFRFTTLLNDLLQSGQRCIFTPLCVSKWVFRCPASLNDLLHSAHLCDFSPLWMSMWVFRFTAWLNDLLHSEHMCNFSPMWVNIWLASWLEYLNDLTHMLQGCGFANCHVQDLICSPPPACWQWLRKVCPHSLYDLSVHVHFSVLFFLISTFNFGHLHLHGQNSHLRKDLISSKKVYLVPSSSWQCCCKTFLHSVVYNVSSNRKNYVILQNIVIEYTIQVPSIHPGPISSKNNSSKT